MAKKVKATIKLKDKPGVPTAKPKPAYNRGTYYSARMQTAIKSIRKKK